MHQPLEHHAPRQGGFIAPLPQHVPRGHTEASSAALLASRCWRDLNHASLCSHTLTSRSRCCIFRPSQPSFLHWPDACQNSTQNQLKTERNLTPKQVECKRVENEIGEGVSCYKNSVASPGFMQFVGTRLVQKSCKPLQHYTSGHRRYNNIEQHVLNTQNPKCAQNPVVKTTFTHRCTFTRRW